MVHERNPKPLSGKSFVPSSSSSLGSRDVFVAIGSREGRSAERRREREEILWPCKGTQCLRIGLLRDRCLVELSCVVSLQTSV
jgi:hypothetical protein